MRMPPKWQWFFLRMAFGLPTYEQMLWLDKNYGDTPILLIPETWEMEYYKEVLS